MRKSIKIILVLVALAIGVVAFGFGRQIPMADQLPLLASLRDTASIIFGVMGIWVAIIFPDALQSLLPSDAGNGKKKKDISKVKRMLAPLVLSTAIIGVALAVTLAYPILKQIDYITVHATNLKGASFAMICLLAFLQVLSLIESLIPQDVIISGMERIEARKQILNRFGGMRQ